MCAREIAKAPVETSTPKSSSSTPFIVAGTGAVVAVAGLVVGGVGLAPAVAFSLDSQKQADAQQQFLAGDATQKTQALAAATQTYAKLEKERAGWNSYGIPMTWAGAGTAIVGAVVTVVGLLWGSSLDDDTAP